MEERVMETNFAAATTLFVEVSGKKCHRVCRAIDSRILSMFSCNFCGASDAFDFLKKTLNPKSQIKVQLGRHQFKVSLENCALVDY
jgi:hypothetical protein